MSLVRYLGLDVGERWIGLAVGDAASGLTTPLRTLRRSSRAADLAPLRRVRDAEGVETIVVGLPPKMDGSFGPQAQRTRALTQALQSLALPLVFYHEPASIA